MTPEVMDTCRSEMKEAIEFLKREMGKVRTGRASPHLLDGIKVNYYGTPTPLNQLATISIPESRLIAIQPWDINSIGEIEKAIQKSGLGLNPSNDGKIIRITIPALTEERRKELAKVVRKLAEEGKIQVRNARRDANEMLKSLKKDKEISEDEMFRAQDEVQKITDEFIKKVDELLQAKEKEIIQF
ncbi:MAG: ribosome recycling factor [Deltaproteobacteria bacterium]|nr:ribosome recycling factor [Deltaproteobacteria bacterium]